MTQKHRNTETPKLNSPCISKRVSVFLCFCVSVSCMFSVLAQAPAASWPQWRGPARDGVASSFTPPAAWPAQLTKRWEAPVGAGHSSPVDLRQPRRAAFASGRPRSHRRLRPAVGQAVVGRRRRRALHDEPGGNRSWPGPEVDAGDRRRPRLHARHQRHLLRARSGNRQVVVAQTRAPHAADVRHRHSPMVEGTTVIAFLGGTNKGALTAMRCRDRRGQMGNGPATALVCVADRGHDRRHAADHHAIAERPRRRRRGQGPAVVAGADQDAVRTEFGDARR